jgi:hypothetical protein
MFELHVVVAGIVIFNILKLLMEIMPNYPTQFAVLGARGNCFRKSVQSEVLLVQVSFFFREQYK